MGLDMYLSRNIRLTNLQGIDLPEITTLDNDWQDSHRIVAHQSVMYWRKANAIHRWFVDNIQDGEDNCHPYSVSIHDLISLADTCENALNNRDHELLPPQDGFFFGSTEIDDYYWDELKNTHDKLRELISQHTDDMDYTYQASW